MKRKIRNAAGNILAWILIFLGRAGKAKKAAQQHNTITALGFHNPSARLFRNIVTWFENNSFVFISTEQLHNILNNGAACPKGAVWISLDDAWRGNIDNVVPVAIERNIPITIFVCTGAVEEGAFWWRKVQQHPEVLPDEYRDINTLKLLPDEKREQLIDQVTHSVSGFPREAMTIDEATSLSSVPQVTLGAHTVTHPILPNCSDARIEHEITESQRKLENWTGKKVTVFAYPNGSYDGRERHVLETHEFELAVTTRSGPGYPDTDRFLFPRNLLMDDGSFSENLCHALGIWEPIVNNFKSIFHWSLW